MSSRIGNDIVDLADPDIVGAHDRERLVRRICHGSELERMARAQHRKQLLWSLFAAKEAAFKVVCKLGPAPVFAHREFVVSADLRSVRHEGRTLVLDIETTQDWVHAVVTTGHGHLLRGVERLSPTADPSKSVRALLIDAVARQLGCGQGELRVERQPQPGSWDRFGPPTLLRGDRLLPVDISLSHDGRFAAFAASTEAAHLEQS